MDILEDFLEIFSKQKLFYTLIIIFVLYFVNWIIKKFIIRSFKSLDQRYKWKKISSYLFILVGFISILFIWFYDEFQMGTFLGLFSAGLAIALRDLLTNFIGWIFIITKRPLLIGDRIQIGEKMGDVVDIRIFQFSILEIGNWVQAEQNTGRIVHIPNKKLFDSELANYTADFPFIWNEIPVLLTFESDWKKAKEFLLKKTKEIVSDQVQAAKTFMQSSSRRYMIYYGKLTPIVYTSVEASGVLLTIRYLCDPRKRRSTEEEIWEKVLNKFADDSDLNFAYPTKRLYFNSKEKPRHENGIEDKMEVPNN